MLETRKTRLMPNEPETLKVKKKIINKPKKPGKYGV